MMIKKKQEGETVLYYYLEISDVEGPAGNQLQQSGPQFPMI